MSHHCSAFFVSLFPNAWFCFLSLKVYRLIVGFLQSCWLLEQFVETRVGRFVDWSFLVIFGLSTLAIFGDLPSSSLGIIFEDETSSNHTLFALFNRFVSSIWFSAKWSKFANSRVWRREKYRRSRRTIGTNRRNNPGQCVSYGREVSEGHRDVRQLNSGMDYPQIHFVCYDMYVFTLKNKLKTQF